MVSIMISLYHICPWSSCKCWLTVASPLLPRFTLAHTLLLQLSGLTSPGLHFHRHRSTWLALPILYSWTTGKVEGESIIRLLLNSFPHSSCSCSSLLLQITVILSIPFSFSRSHHPKPFRSLPIPLNPVAYRSWSFLFIQCRRSQEDTLKWGSTVLSYFA